LAKNISYAAVSIANGATTSSAITLDANRIPLSIRTPAVMTGTALTFEASTDADGTAYYPLYDESTLYSITISTSAARVYAFKRSVMDGVKQIKVVSNGTEAAARSLVLVSGE
jgi:hypothetical protein